VSGRLRTLARGAPGPQDPAPERCEMCSAPIAHDHSHLLQLADRELLCVCRACATLFDRGAAAEGRYRLVPDRRLRLDDLELSDAAWEELRLPVDIAFLFHSSAAGRVQAFYPSPMGPTESLLPLDAWASLEAANPVLREMQTDVEALLVHRARGARRQWLVPIDDCYALVGVIRTRWRGFTGGAEVWEALSQFFDDLDRRSRPSRREMTCAP
jgi:hypothetical protein